MYKTNLYNANNGYEIPISIYSKIWSSYVYQIIAIIVSILVCWEMTARLESALGSHPFCIM